MYSLLLQETSKLITMPEESTPSQGFEHPNVCSKKSAKKWEDWLALPSEFSEQ